MTLTVSADPKAQIASTAEALVKEMPSLKKLGKEIRAYCNVSLKLHERELLEEFEGEIGRHREVRACYHLTGAFDYLVEVEVANMDAYHRFITQRLAAMPNIATVQSMFVMKDILTP